MKTPDAISAFRRSEQAWCAQLATGDPLTFGVAYVAEEFPTLTGGTQLRDVWLADVDHKAVYSQAEAYFSARKSVCNYWVPAVDQPITDVAAVLAPHGWRERHRVIRTLPPGAGIKATAGDFRILPARAMRKAYAATFVNEPPDRVASAMRRLDDSNMDAFVAMRDNHPAGRIAYLEVGDIARMTDLFVIPEARQRGAGAALVSHFAQLARRLLPRVVVAACDREDTVATGFLVRCGLVESGLSTEFVRSESSAASR